MGLLLKISEDENFILQSIIAMEHALLGKSENLELKFFQQFFLLTYCT